MNTHHVPTGMTIVFGRHDLEHALMLLHESGFEGAEIWIDQIAPLKPSIAFARAAHLYAGELSMKITALNAIGHESFEPHGGGASLRSTAAHMAEHMILAHHLGAEKILIWDGVRNPRMSIGQHDKNLMSVIQLAREYCGLDHPPVVSVEFHPFTYALAEGHQTEAAEALLSVDAGICLDFCHFGVSLGPDWVEQISPAVMKAVNHIHYADSDCATSELHHPPGLGRLNMVKLARLFSGRKLSTTWDLYGWPNPLSSYRQHFPEYKTFLEAVQGISGGGES